MKRNHLPFDQTYPRIDPRIKPMPQPQPLWHKLALRLFHTILLLLIFSLSASLALLIYAILVAKGFLP